MVEQLSLGGMSGKDARLSDCGRYRYSLWRHWGNGGSVLWIMLNPSTADASIDDPTIRKCVGFSQRLGFGELRVANLFAYRATEPAELERADIRHEDITGPENDWFIGNLVAQSNLVIAAWGSSLPKRRLARAVDVANQVKAQSKSLWCLGTTQEGHPRHPLMLGYDTTLQTFGGYRG